MSRKQSLVLGHVRIAVCKALREWSVDVDHQEFVEFVVDSLPDEFRSLRGGDRLDSDVRIPR